MLHLRDLNLLRLEAITAHGQPLGDLLEVWETSERRKRLRERLLQEDGVEPDDVIMNPQTARERGLTSTVSFPIGNLAPEGSVIKSTAIDPSVVDEDGVYRKSGPARVFTTERDAIAAIKGQTETPIKAGDIIVLIGRGPLGSGMEETYQLTAALKYIPWGKEVALITDARFSGVSTGACIGHVGPEGLAGGPIARVQEGDTIQIIVDRVNLSGSINLVGHNGQRYSPEEGAAVLAARPIHPALAPDAGLPDDTRLWAALQNASGGTWGGCVFDVDQIISLLEAGARSLEASNGT
jgi:dihydroxyacid dehydratase/phosphogluconate dehydratase